MALGEWSLFSWKSKATAEKEREEYAKWAFPHGQSQRDKLEALFGEVNPKEKTQFMMMGFLTCKELYERFLEKTGTSDSAVFSLLNKEKRYKQIIRKKDMPMYIALVLADADYGEQCEYPPAKVVLEKIQELKERIN